jgi:predicted amidohydrolase YtcJ
MENNSIDVYFNGKIITMDKNDSIFDTIAIFKDKILFIGSKLDVDQKIEALNENWEINYHNLNGKCVVPGFIDAHIHPILSIYFLTQCNLSEVKSIENLKKKIIEQNKELDEDDWFFGIDLMEDRFSVENERVFPTKEILDHCCSSRPVVVLRHDAHICAANSIALEKLNISKETLNEFKIDGGEIRLDKDGNPNGIFTEAATSIVISKVPINFNRIKKCTVDFGDQLSSCGITSCGGILQLEEFGPAGKLGSVESAFMQTLIREGLIEQDYVFFFITNKPKKLKRLKKVLEKLSDKENRFSVGGVKLFADGTFGASTAYMYESFSDSKEKNCGFMVNKIEVLKKICYDTLKLNLGFDLECHVIGDRGNHLVAEMFNEIGKEFQNMEYYNKESRFHLEHASIIKNESIEIASKNNNIFVCQPNFIQSEFTWLEKRLGKERIKITYPFRNIIDLNGIIAGSSDCPIESPSVLKGIQNCVTRRGFVPEQNITPYEALKMFTYNAAYAIGQEDIKGSLEPGKLADIVILDNNPLTIDKQNIENIQILSTIHRGKIIFELKKN